MAQLINLRSVRKNKVRAQSEAEAKLKRQRHGRTKAEKALEAAKNAKTQRALDGLQLMREAPPEDPASE